MQLCSKLLLCLLLLCVLHNRTSAQDSVYAKLYSLPDKFFNRVSAKSRNLERGLERQMEKYLARLTKKEKNMQKKLWKKDTVAAKKLFGDASTRYEALKNKFSDVQNLYSNHLDSMQTALRFLAQAAASQQKFSAILVNYNKLQGKLNQANDLRKYLKERQQYLKQHLKEFGLTKEFRKFQKDVYYYHAQVDEYKRILDDPSKLEAKLLRLVAKIRAFKDFFNKQSMLAGMFRLPGPDPATAFEPIPGLQTRASVQQAIVQRFGSGPDVSRAIQQNIQSARTQIDQLKDKVTRLGGSNSDMNMPDFKPNSQKVKGFWKRIELGANVQSVRSNSFFPVTSDLALTAGYKLNDRSIAGIGISYKLGWGQNIRHITLTHEGIGFKSFLDLKLKGSFYASGGFEYNYQKPFYTIRQLYMFDSWKQSGLIGIQQNSFCQQQIF
jgi:hypothetical protein